MNHRKRSRSGLTILDVVVTIVVLLVLVALFIPAGTRTREAAPRSRCKNNLKQIGLALHNYHDIHKTYPPGWIVSETKEQSSGFGWGYHILPFFDQAPLFEKFNSHEKLSDTASGNAALAETILTAMRCPSEDGPDQVKSNWVPLLATSNYVGNFGVGIPISYSQRAESQGKLVHGREFQGILGPNSRIRIRDGKDGMSNIIMAGERRLSKDGVDWSLGRIEGQFNSYWAGIPNVEAVSPLAIVATATGGEFDGSVKDESGNWTGLPRVGNIDEVTTEAGRKRLPYFQINRDVQGEPLRSSDQVTAGFSSWHNGGCQVVLGDGSVRFLSENIDPTIYTNLMRRADGKTLGEF